MEAFQLFGQGVRRSKGNQARRYNLLAARLIADLVKNCFGPSGMDKIFVDIMGEVTVTRDGAALLRKLDVEHPAAKVMIEASNAVDNQVGDGTTSVVVFAGALAQRAQEMLDLGISPSIIVDGYARARELSLEILQGISQECKSSDARVMRNLVNTCLHSKALSYAGTKAIDCIVEAVCAVSDPATNSIEADDIKIEQKQGSQIDIELVRGIVIDKTVDSSAMRKMVENARILLIDDELEGERTRTDAEIQITSPADINSYSHSEKMSVKFKVQHIVDSGANVVISRRGISTLAQSLLREADIISVRRVKENDLIWLTKATGASITEQLDHERRPGHVHNHDDDKHHRHDHFDHYRHGDIEFTLGYAARVCERPVGDDRMVFVEGCKNPRSLTLVLRANSKGALDECNRSAIDAISVLRDFKERPWIVHGGGSAEAAMAAGLREMAATFEGREQIVIQRFADALEEVPLTIARNAGMDVIDTLVQLRSLHASSNGDRGPYGVDIVNRRIARMPSAVIEPAMVKEQIIKTAVEVINLLVRVDDVLMARPAMYTHTHDDGTEHSHAGGQKQHSHEHFDRLGKSQRPAHHYY